MLSPEVEKQGLPQSALVEIRMKNGGKYSKFVKYFKGHPQNPLTEEEIREKFTNCVAYASKPLPQKNTERIIDRIDHLEEVADITEMVKLLVA